MKKISSRLIMATYENNGYLYDVIQNKDMAEVYISNPEYGTMKYLFGIPANDNVLEIIEGNIETEGEVWELDYKQEIED